MLTLDFLRGYKSQDNGQFPRFFFLDNFFRLKINQDEDYCIMYPFGIIDDIFWQFLYVICKRLGMGREG